MGLPVAWWWMPAALAWRIAAFLLKNLPSYAYYPIAPDGHVHKDPAKVARIEAKRISEIKTQSATVVILAKTLSDSLITCIEGWLENDPGEILVLSPWAFYNSVLWRCAALKDARVRVLQRSDQDKCDRKALLRAAKVASTPYVVLACCDSNFTSPAPRSLAWLLGPFASPEGDVDLVGALQQTAPGSQQGMFLFTWFEELQAQALEVDSTTCWVLDGSLVLPINGAMAAFTAKGKTREGGFIQRWVAAHGYKARLQIQPDCQMQSMEPMTVAVFGKVWLRYRDEARFTCAALFGTKKLWRRHPLTTIMLFDKLISPFTTLLAVSGAVAYLALLTDIPFGLLCAIGGVTMLVLIAIGNYRFLMVKKLRFLGLPLVVLYTYVHALMQVVSQLYVACTVTQLPVGALTMLPQVVTLLTAWIPSNIFTWCCSSANDSLEAHETAESGWTFSED
eukprot:jgi/Chlat1/4681/Chrsp3S05618